MTIREAAKKYVECYFDGIQTDLLDRLMRFDCEDWREVTVPAVGHPVFLYCTGESGEVVSRAEDLSEYKVRLDGGEEVTVKRGGLGLDFYNVLPAYARMWSFREPIDVAWLEERGGLEVMSDCGFRIFESSVFGYFFGIDGANYDFYESHWIPLYKARGLHWHSEE